MTVLPPQLLPDNATIDADPPQLRDDGYALTSPETMLVLLVRYAGSFDAEARRFAAEAASLIRVDP